MLDASDAALTHNVLYLARAQLQFAVAKHDQTNNRGDAGYIPERMKLRDVRRNKNEGRRTLSDLPCVGERDCPVRPSRTDSEEHISRPTPDNRPSQPPQTAVNDRLYIAQCIQFPRKPFRQTARRWGVRAQSAQRNPYPSDIIAVRTLGEGPWFFAVLSPDEMHFYAALIRALPADHRTCVV